MPGLSQRGAAGATPSRTGAHYPAVPHTGLALDGLPWSIPWGREAFGPTRRQGRGLTVDIQTLTARRWKFVTEERSGTEGKEAPLREGVNLAGSRGARDSRTPCKGVQFPWVIRNSLGTVL